MAFAPVNMTPLANTGLGLGGDTLSLPGLGGAALDRIVPGGRLDSLQALAAPSSLTAAFEQSLQTQQLTQMAGLLAMLMQNRPAGSTGGQANSAGMAPVSETTGATSGGSAGGTGNAATGGTGGAAPQNTGSTVERQGKPIGGHIAKQFDEMVAAAKKDGVNITITSGKRSRAEQERLYAAYKNGTGNLAAKPGTSNHESGDALDLGPPSAYGWLKQNAGKFGFKNTIPSEPWHWSLSGN